MMLVRMKWYPVLFWGLSVLFSMESKSVSISNDISNDTSAVPLEMTTEKTHHLTTARGSHNDTEQQPTVDSINSPVVTVAAINVSGIASSEEAVSTTQTHINNGTAAGIVAMNTGNNTSSWRPTVSHISTVTPADTTQPSHSANKTEKPAERPQQSAVTSAATAATTSETKDLSTSNSSSFVPDHPTGASKSPSEPTSSSISSTSASSTITHLDSTTQPSHLLDSSTASLSDNVTETSNTSSSPPSPPPPPPPSSHPASTTDTPTSSTGQNSTSEAVVTISSIATTAVSTNQSTAVFIPKTPPVTTEASPPTTTTTTTTAPCGTSSGPLSTVVQTCASKRGVVSKCLIAIASLAGLATVFMVSTIVLCTKLSTRKYRLKTPQQGTEMMCISSLLPERNYTYARQRNPVSNGVLVIPSGGDSDDDEGDNFTLRSFLPDNDRYV